MKNYLIETTVNGYFVHVGDMPYGGPYKNEESAKRRIRDLKKREAATPSNPFEIKPGQTITEAPATTNALGDANWNGKPLRNFNALPISRPRGVYPAVSKHAYQR